MKLGPIIALIFVALSTGAWAQNEELQFKKNGVYAESYFIRHDFSEGFVSINFETTLGKKERMKLRVGAYPDFESTVSFPLTLSWITGPQKKHHLEYGIGLVFRVEHFVDPLGINEREWFYDVPALMVPIMYRYQKSSGWYFRAGTNLFVSWPTLLSPSVSLGYQF